MTIVSHMSVSIQLVTADHLCVSQQVRVVNKFSVTFNDEKEVERPIESSVLSMT